MEKEGAMEAVEAKATTEAEAKAEAEAEAEGEAVGEGEGEGEGADKERTITLKVAHGLRLHQVSVSPHSTFGQSLCIAFSCFRFKGFLFRFRVLFWFSQGLILSAPSFVASSHNLWLL